MSLRGGGSKLRIINQANLGGSGRLRQGHVRGRQNGSDYVLLLDDDIVIEPESILRMMAFADRCKNPTIVGGHMFDLYSRSALHTSVGETIDARTFSPSQPHEDMQMRHDFSVVQPSSDSWLHRRFDVDYNGWWMCMIPTSIIRDIGLSAAAFHQVGRLRIRASRTGCRIPHSFAARRGRLARFMAGQGRPGGLAGLLPRPQQTDYCAPAQPASQGRGCSCQVVPGRCETPCFAPVLYGTKPPSRPGRPARGTWPPAPDTWHPTGPHQRGPQFLH